MIERLGVCPSLLRLSYRSEEHRERYIQALREARQRRNSQKQLPEVLDTSPEKKLIDEIKNVLKDPNFNSPKEEG